MAKLLLDVRLYEEISSRMLTVLQGALPCMSKPLQAVLMKRGYEQDAIFEVVELACGVLLVFGTVAVLGGVTSAAGLAVGAIIGWALGTCFALITFGLSFIIFAITGATIGWCVGALVGGLFGASLCALWLESGILYHPRRYSKEITGAAVQEITSGGERLDIGGSPFILEKVGFTLSRKCGSDLQQYGFLLRPCDEGVFTSTVTDLWVTFSGNAMLALDWLPFCNSVLLRQSEANIGIAFFLFDYPGYGENAGHTAPRAVCDASCAAVKAALAHLKDPVPSVHLIGHSLGAAAASQLAVRLADEGFQTGRLLMSAPFLSIPDMALHLISFVPSMLPVPERLQKVMDLTISSLMLLLPPILRGVVPHVWGNVSMVKRAAEAGWHIGIVHGAQDRLVPCSMGLELSRHAGMTAEFVKVPRASHNDVLLVGLSHYARLMGLES